MTDTSGGIEPGANERFCYNCGAPNPPDFVFCLRCGKRINFLRPPAPPGAITAVERLPGPYPARFEAEYPAELSRLSTFFRLILAIPLIIFVAILGGSGSFVAPGMSFSFGLINFVLLVYAIAVLCRGRPPRWMFETVASIQRFLLRAYTYFILMTDRYPPFDGDWPVRYEVDRPERISRWQILIWKTIMSIPHFIVLSVLSLVVGILTFIAWFAILFTGRYPQGLYNFSAGWLRWYARVGAYWISLTDEFPPYSFDAEAGRGSRTSYLASAGVGTAVMAGLIGGIVALFLISPQTNETQVAYEGLLNGEPSTVLDAGGWRIQLTSADDPYEFSDGLFQPEFGNRFVSFDIEVVNQSGGDLSGVFEGHFRLKDSEGDGHRPVITSLGGLTLPRALDEGQRAPVTAIFEIPIFAEPTELTYSPGVFLAFGERARFRFNGGDGRASDPNETIVSRSYEITAAINGGVAEPVDGLINVGTLEIDFRAVTDPKNPAPRRGARHIEFEIGMFNAGAPAVLVNSEAFRLMDSRGSVLAPKFLSFGGSDRSLDRSVLSSNGATTAYVVFELVDAADPAELTYNTELVFATSSTGKSDQVSFRFS